MRKLFLFALLGFCQFAIAAENDPPVQDSDQQENTQVRPDSNQDNPDDGSDLISAEVLETNEAEEESSTRFIPTEEISQDLGVSFPTDI